VYRDEQIETLLDRARSVRDQAERLRLYHEIDRLWVAEQAAILPVFYGRTLLARRPWVRGVSSSPMSGPRLDLAVVNRRSSS
jgi:ABC-type transport system substrate-binding protein